MSDNYPNGITEVYPEENPPTQKRVTLNGSDWLMVEVPEDAWPVEINYPMNKIVAWLDGYIEEINIPIAYYTLIGKGDEISERQWMKMVDVACHMEDFERLVQDGWWNYQNEGIFKTAKESGHSWIRSNGFEPNKVVLLKIN